MYVSIFTCNGLEQMPSQHSSITDACLDVCIACASAYVCALQMLYLCVYVGLKTANIKAKWASHKDYDECIARACGSIVRMYTNVLYTCIIWWPEHFRAYC